MKLHHAFAVADCVKSLKSQNNKFGVIISDVNSLDTLAQLSRLDYKEVAKRIQCEDPQCGFKHHVKIGCLG